MLLYFLLVPVVSSAETCLIDCRATPKDLPTVSNEITTLLSASVGGYSVDFNEECHLSNSLGFKAENPSSAGFFEYIASHESAARPVRSYHGVCQSGFTKSFDYLTAPDSGAIYRGQYSYKCQSSDFFPDDSFDALPRTRNQTCMYGLRLVPGETNQFGGAFWTKKQPVVYGFDTTFKFRVLSRSVHCGADQSPNKEKWCYPRGGRGFAFMIQNAGSPGVNGVGDSLSYKISTLGRVNLGYSFPRNLAIEFDYLFHTDSNDPSWNHVAVMVPVSKQPSEGDNSNSADHATNTLAIATGKHLPELHEGLHTVRVTYDVHASNKWEHLSTDWYSRPLSDNQKKMMSFWSHNKPGILTVYLDGKSIIRTLVDLSLVIQADSVLSGSGTSSDAPNEASPGSAWVGFVASTGTDNYASPLIVDWRWSVNTRCPADDLSDPETMTCARGSVVEDKSTYPKFTLRNIGTVDIQVTSTLADAEPIVCRNGFLSFNQIHPYFLGCGRTLALGAQLKSIVIADTIGVRSLGLTDPTLVDRDYTGTVFLRRQIPDYCVIEHDSDPYRFYFAHCDCSFCARIFDNQQMFSVFYSALCYDRYRSSCSCFEVSQMKADTYMVDYANRANPWKFISQPGYWFQTKNMQFQQHTVCRGCKFDNHCSRLNKLGVCDTPAYVYRVGNPLTPSIGGSFKNWYRGEGAEDGAIKGDTCDCGDRILEPSYVNTRGTAQLFPVYLLAYLQGTRADCANCLRLAGSNCASVCGSPQLRSYLHLPSGPSCATCMLSSASVMDLTPARLNKLRICAYSAINSGGDPWVDCTDTVGTWLSGTREEKQRALKTYLNGIATHHLTECPSRDLETHGAVCAPNLFASVVIPMQVLARGPAEASVDGIYFPAWWDGVACVNAACELQAKVDCYVRRYQIEFSQDPITFQVICQDALGSALECFLESSGGAVIGFNKTTSAVVLDKKNQQYGYTAPLDRSAWSSDPSISGMTRKSLEVWASLDPTDRITDVNLDNPVSASSSWGDDYAPSLAVDGSMQTFWQSQTWSNRSFTAEWTVDFGSNVQNAQGYTIYWSYSAANFTVETAIGNSGWELVDRFVNNAKDTSESTSFFSFTRLRVRMTAANKVRPDGQDVGKYAFGIKEIVIVKDSMISRFKPIEVVQSRSFRAFRALDGDLSTWWSTSPGKGAGTLQVSYKDQVGELALIRVVFRKNYAPGSVQLSHTLASGEWMDIACYSIGCDSNPENGFDYILSLSRVGLTGAPLGILSTDFMLSATNGKRYYGDSIIQVSEFEVYERSSGLAVYSPTSCVLSNRQPCPSIPGGGLGTLLAGQTAFLTNWVSTNPLTATESVGIFEMEFFDSNSIPASITVSSPSSLTLIPANSDLQVSTSFAVVVTSISDLTVRVVAQAGKAVNITKMALKPMNKLTLQDPIVNDEWEEVLPVSYPVQGLAMNVVDKDFRSEWRTRLGAPSMSGSTSLDLDYVLEFNLGKYLQIDSIFLQFSYRSDWFRVDGETSYSCEWTPGLTQSTGTDCLGGQISVVEKENLYAFTNRLSSYGSSYWSQFDLTLMQASANDKLANQALIGIQEVELYSAYPRIVPLGSNMDSNSAALIFDSDFKSVWFSPATAEGLTIWLDLGAPNQRVREVEMWWFSNATIALASSVLFEVVYDQSAIACNDADALVADAQFVVPDGTHSTYSVSKGAIRCVKIQVFSTHSLVGISEIVLKKSAPSFRSPVIASSMGNPDWCFDGNSETSASAPGTGMSEFVIFDLVDLQPDDLVWGVNIGFTSPRPELILAGINLVLCGSNNASDLSSCKAANGKSIPVIVEQATQFTFGPGQSSNGRVAIEFVQPTSPFEISGIEVFASPNLGPTVEVDFRDDRKWDNQIETANDGNISTYWVSERDVTSADIKISLIPNGDGYTALDPAYAQTALLVSPNFISSVASSFFWPLEHFSLWSSLDGVAWTSRALTDTFYGNFLRVSLERPSINASLVTGSSFQSPMFGVSEMVATTSPSIEANRAIDSSDGGVAGYSLSGSNPWIIVPPAARALVTLPAGGADISGLVFQWLFPPTNWAVNYYQGSTMVRAETLFIRDPAVSAPALLTATNAGQSNVDSIEISVSSFGTRNYVQMAALKSFKVFSVDSLVDIEAALAPALDDSPSYLVDSDLSTYYSSLTAATISVPVPTSQTMGKISIVWRSVCASFQVVVTQRAASPVNVTLLNTSSNADIVTDILFSLSISEIFINVGQASSIFEVKLWSAKETLFTISESTASSLSPSAAIDGSSFTFWMARPSRTISATNPVKLTLDLGSVYPVKLVQVLWGWSPFSNDWSESLLETKRDIQVSTDGTVFSSVISAFDFNSTGRFDIATSRLRFRYLRVVLLGSYVDVDLDPLGQIISTSIRDIKIVYDDNLSRDAQDKVVIADGGWWDFSPQSTKDGKVDTFWLSRRGQNTAVLRATFGSALNLAGIEIEFTYIAGSVGFYKSDDCSTFSLIKSVTGNQNAQVVLSGQEYQFRALCVEIRLSNALTQIQNPDKMAQATQAIFGIKKFAIMSNMGGGGVFGIEAKIGGVWGSVFDTITYAPFQPTQWNLLSNQQLRSSEVNGATNLDDISDIVHIVASFSDTTIQLYRNGVEFGSPYPAPTIPWDMVEDVRLVFGVRSSAFVNNPDISALMGYGVPGNSYSYLNPFFSGQIKSMTLFSRALIQEEVLGLYEAGVTGVRERGCHCYDACPVGRNRLYPDVDVPCSGQGVCRRAYDKVTGLPTTGVCDCTPGFFGPNCEKHCSLNGGCCSVDDDCPTSLVCDAQKYTCVTP